MTDAVYVYGGYLATTAILAAYARVGTGFPLCFEFPGGDDPEAAIAGSLAHLDEVMSDE